MIEIYGFDPDLYQCVPCINAKKLCEMKCKEYIFKSVVKAHLKGYTKDEDVYQEMLLRDDKLRNEKSVNMPCIFVDGVYIGGFVELKKLLR